METNGSQSNCQDTATALRKTSKELDTTPANKQWHSKALELMDRKDTERKIEWVCNVYMHEVRERVKSESTSG